MTFLDADQINNFFRWFIYTNFASSSYVCAYLAVCLFIYFLNTHLSALLIEVKQRHIKSTYCKIRAYLIRTYLIHTCYWTCANRNLHTCCCFKLSEEKQHWLDGIVGCGRNKKYLYELTWPVDHEVKFRLIQLFCMIDFMDHVNPAKLCLPAANNNNGKIRSSFFWNLSFR